MANFFRTVRKLARSYETSFIFTHHVPKPPKDGGMDPMWMLRGAGDIQGFPDSVLIFLPGQDSSEVKVVHTKMRNAEKLSAFNLQLRIEDDLGRAAISYYEPDPVGIENATRSQILAVISGDDVGEMSTEQIAARTGLSPKTVVEHLRVLSAGQLVNSRKVGGEWWHQRTLTD
jgi:hypothetical protein